MKSIPELFPFSFEYKGRTIHAGASRELVEDALGASANAETMWAWFEANLKTLTAVATQKIERGQDESLLIIESRDIGW